MIDLILLRNCATDRPSANVHAALSGPAERLEQGVQVVGPVAQTARRVDWLRLASTKAAQIGRNYAAAGVQVLRERLEESTGREIAVNQQDRCARLGSADPTVGGQARGLDRDGVQQ